MNAHFHIGSCAWDHEAWRASFYPHDLPPDRWLAWYANVFNAVEIDSTFHAPPAPDTLGHWLADTPPHFRFTCKAPRIVTHQLRLRGCEKVLEDFLETIRPLHARLGPILVQLPPTFDPGQDGAALRDFVIALPQGWRFAIEFRHADWHQPRFAKLLEDHGVCWAWCDRSSIPDQDQAPFDFLPETADFLYLRLMGDWQTRPGGNRSAPSRHRQWSRSLAIESWAARLRMQPDQVRNIYVMCDNHYEGFAPASCRDLAAQLGIEIALPPTAPPRPAATGQGQLDLL